MSTKQEIAAGMAKTWLGTYGSRESMGIVDDIVNILEICHNFRDREGLPAFTADELGDAIADYVIEAFSTPVEFKDVQVDEAVKTDHPDEVRPIEGIGTGSAGE
jgi:hypothetical protein